MAQQQAEPDIERDQADGREVVDAGKVERRFGIPRQCERGHRRDAVLAVEANMADNVLIARGGAHRFLEYERDDERNDAEIDVPDPAIDHEIAEDEGEERRQGDRQHERQAGRPEVERSDRECVAAEAEEGGLAEAEDADEAPEKPFAQPQHRQDRDDRQLE